MFEKVKPKDIIIRFIPDPDSVYITNKERINAGKKYYQVHRNTGEIIKEIHAGSFDNRLTRACTVFLKDRLWFGNRYNMYHGNTLTVKDIIDSGDIGYIIGCITNNYCIWATEVHAYLDKFKDLAR